MEAADSARVVVVDSVETFPRSAITVRALTIGAVSLKQVGVAFKAFEDALCC